MASLFLWDLNFFFYAKDSLLELDLEVVAKVLTFFLSLTLGAKKIAEEIIKDIIKIAPESEVKDAARIIRITKPLISEAFFLVAQNFVSFVDFLELFLCFLVVGIAVGVVFQGKLSVGLFYLFVTCFPRDVEYLVIVFFHCNTLYLLGFRFFGDRNPGRSQQPAIQGVAFL